MLKHLVISALLMLSINLLTAQRALLIEYQEDLRDELSNDCQQKVDYWKTLESNDSIHFVTVMNIESVQEDGRIKFILPGLTDTIYATAISVREKTDSTIVWSGIIDCYDGNLLLISKDSTTIGYINYKGKTYTIRKLCGDYVVLIVHSEENVEHECGNSSEVQPRSNDNGAQQLKGPQPPQVCCISTILVLYTDAAETAGDPESEAELLVENTWQALRNSQVCHTVDLVGVEHIDWDESGSIFADRQTIINDPQATALRNQYSADMVMVLTGSYGSTFGISWLDQLDDEHGYTLTAITSPPGRHSFPHEWAHNLGARHDSDPTAGFAHGFNFGVGRTLLAGAGLNDNRELHYSNPNIEFNSVATGVVDQRDNARQLDINGCTIAKYRTRNHFCEDFTVFIDGPPIIEAGNSYEWCAHASGCGSNMTYAWEYSVDGFNWDIGGYDECMSMFVGSEHLHVRLKVICDNGCFNVGYIFSINKDGLFNENCLEARFSKDSKRNLSTDMLTPYPNPTSDFINLNFELTDSKDELYTLRIHNAFGRSVVIGELSKSEISGKSIDVSQYQSGIYFITIESESEYAISKFMVRR